MVGSGRGGGGAFPWWGSCLVDFENLLLDWVLGGRVRQAVLAGGAQC